MLNSNVEKGMRGIPRSVGTPTADFNKCGVESHWQVPFVRLSTPVTHSGRGTNGDLHSLIIKEYDVTFKIK